MYQSLKKLFLELSAREKKQLIFLLLILVLSSVIEVVGVASIFPFIAVATDPSILATNSYLNAIQAFFGFDVKAMLLFLGVSVLLLVLISNIFIAFSTWFTAKFIANMVHTIMCKLLTNYLSQSYSYHVDKNSAELINRMTSEVARIVNGGILSSLKIVAKGLLVITMVAFLFAVNPMVSLAALLLLGGSYLIVFSLFRNKLEKAGRELTDLFSIRQKYMSESLTGIKELMILGREKFYLNEFHRVSEQIVSRKMVNSVIGEIPKYIIETIAFGGIIVLTIFMVATDGDTQQALPLLALYGLAGYRMMPALQEVFRSFASLKYDVGAIDALYEDLKIVERRVLFEEHNDFIERLLLKEQLALNLINYSYPGANKKALNNLTLTIPAKSSLGIIGTSGSGKSTLVDLVLGLIQPQSGEITIDGQALAKSNVRNWQASIGYVPQTIFLSDANITQNIAFGIPPEEINHEQVIKAAQLANLHDFIVDSLDEGYDTIIGEAGVRLSGGQRQRIGIARALYHDPSILVLDEATSALDGPTEEAIMRSVYKLTENLTVIMIAHRLSTILQCDNIIVMSHGELVAQGDHDYLVQHSEHFQALLKKTDSSQDD